MRAEYGIGELINNAISVVYTKLFWKKARLIRRPFYCRGKKYVLYKDKLTIGYGCRFEALQENKKVQHGKIIIGENCSFGDRVHICALEEVNIGSDCLFASNILVNDSQHGDYTINNASNPTERPNERKMIYEKIVIGNNVWLGENVVVLKGTTIGSGCVVGANSVVKGNFPDNCVIVGNPARVVKHWDEQTKGWKKVNCK